MCKYKQLGSPYWLLCLDPPSQSIRPVVVQDRKEFITYDATKTARKVWSGDVETPHIMLTTYHASIHAIFRYINHDQDHVLLISNPRTSTMFVPKLFILVAAVAVVVNALPSPQDDPTTQHDPPTIHQPTEEEERAAEAAFLALPFEERLAAHSEHKLYRPVGTVKCVVSTYTWRLSICYESDHHTIERVHRRGLLQLPYP
jgi:hypothetical protein